ncbi:MAG: HpcH/HpaI aldolase family protein [Syntrophales bacterium]
MDRIYKEREGPDMINHLKAKLKAGEKVFGTWSMLASPAVMNAIGQAGIDFIIIDMEHGPMNFETAEAQLYATESAGCTPIIRLGEVNDQAILHALEIGAQSLLVSHVSTPEEAARIVKATRYYPEGERGISLFTRRHGYSDEGFAEKLRYANEQIFVGVLVEGEEGLNNLEKICEVDSLDMVYLGVYDISQSVGVPGDVKHPKVIRIVRDCVRMINEKGLIAGSVARDRNYIHLLVETGFRFVSYRVDSAVLREGFETARGWFQESLRGPNHVDK